MKHPSSSLSFFAFVALATQVLAVTDLTFFEHTYCNAGTLFDEYDDTNSLVADTSCHQLPNGTVALYVNEIDDGCTSK